MVTTGYSDRINHALAFAAKHHDRQVRKGARAPYLTRPANVAVILTRYGQSDAAVIAGILHDFVEDCVRENHEREVLDQRIGQKFGSEVIDLLLTITPRTLDDDGTELSNEERREDYLARLSQAPEAARWVCAADMLHDASTLLADLRRTIDVNSVWGRTTGGRDGALKSFRGVYARLQQIGFSAPIMDELGGVVLALEQSPTADPPRAPARA